MNYEQVLEAQKHNPAGVMKVLEGLEWECPECMINIGPASSWVECPTCNGKKKVSYSWTPQRGEFAQIVMGLIVLVDRDGLFEDKWVETSRMGLIEYEKLTPILDWQVIEEILEKAGYWWNSMWSETLGGQKRYGFQLQGKCVLNIIAKSRIEAVYKAVIELGKELK